MLNVPDASASPKVQSLRFWSQVAHVLLGLPAYWAPHSFDRQTTWPAPATMNHDDLDDLRDRQRATRETRRYRASDQDKLRQADDLKRRFARYGGGGAKVVWLKGPGPRWGRWALAALVVAYVAWVVLA